MGCSNCGTAANGKPSGCKGNGGCSSGGCNRLNVYDWLNALPLYDGAKPYSIIEVTFSNGSRKEFFRNNTHLILEKGTWLALEGVGGYDVGQVSVTGELVKLQLKKYGVREAEVTKRVLHLATDEEKEQCQKQKEREPEILIRSRAIARTLKLDMKLCEVEVQADSKKGTFFYTADQRVDFRELIKLFATDFKMKVEMRQIGARQESGKVGGIGSCGRELCCSTWLTDFKSVNTTAARYQNLSINQTKLSGQCGRLKCCLNYELDTYMDALSVFPDHAESLETVKGIAHLQKKDIFKNLMWYSFSDNNKQYPLSIARVKEIKLMNRQGQKADELQPVELETRDTKAGKTADAGFVNDVGQITLKALEKNNSKKKKKPSGNKPANAGTNATGRPEAAAGSRPQRENRPQQPRAATAAGTTPDAEKPQAAAGTDRPQQQNRPQRNNRPQGDKPQGDKPQGDKPQGQEPRQQQARPQQQRRDRPAQPAQPGGEQPKEGAPQNAPKEGSAARPQGNRPQQQRNRPQGNRPQQPRPGGQGPDNSAPAATP